MGMPLLSGSMQRGWCSGFLVASIDANSIGLSWLTIAADGNDRVGAPWCNRRTALPGVIGAVTADDRDALVRRDCAGRSGSVAASSIALVVTSIARIARASASIPG